MQVFTTWCLYIAMIVFCETPCKYLQHGACTLQCLCEKMQVFTTWCLYIAMIVFVSRNHASIYNMVLVHCNNCVCFEKPCKYLQHGACTLQ